MEDVNHKYPKTTIPNTMIAVVMIPATFFFLTNAIAVMIISSTYTIANQAVNPICNTSSNPDFIYVFVINTTVSTCLGTLVSVSDMR